jgi:hypothetical protein
MFAGGTCFSLFVTRTLHSHGAICGYADPYYDPSVSSRVATIFRVVGQAILPAAAFSGGALAAAYAAA